eukprot:comp11698_c0_seq1/m.6248 comp11698_c0_seq1/g.6248  ORF comp11698_c0_seq1/g.6248 comp11698_c0_seq1/m.6248 type:complete len:691 (-) comp11698_c0_seq1:430-2502(-)
MQNSLVLSMAAVAAAQQALPQFEFPYGHVFHLHGVTGSSILRAKRSAENGVATISVVELESASPSAFEQNWAQGIDTVCAFSPKNGENDPMHMESRVHLASAMGCAGVVLRLPDITASKDQWDATISRMASRAHHKGMSMGMHSDTTAWVPNLGQHVDFAVSSNCASSRTCTDFDWFTIAGKPVLHAELHVNAENACSEAGKRGFVAKYKEGNTWHDCVPVPALRFRRQVAETATKSDWKAQKLTSKITQVNPMKGLVLFSDYSPRPPTNALSLEFFSLPFSAVVKEKGKYDWSKVEEKLNGISNRGHQAVLRFWYGSPGSPSGEPDYIKKLPKFKPITVFNPSEGRKVEYTNWGSQEIKSFNDEFFRKLAAKYDGDKRLAFLQVGFGHWSEYHIYNLTYKFGQNFPDYQYQTKFLKETSNLFKVTPWQISVDSVDPQYFQGPFFVNRELLQLRFGCFMDTIMAGDPDRMQNAAKSMLLRYDERSMFAPMGGEIAYEDAAQKYSLSRKGPNFGESIDFVSRRDHVTYSLANDALRSGNNNEFGDVNGKIERFKEVGMLMGYKYVITSYHVNFKTKTSHVTVRNDGTAPAYYDMYISIDGKWSDESLRMLQPGDEKGFYVKRVAGGKVAIVSDHITDKQEIQFEANTTGEEEFSHPVPNDMVSKYAYFETKKGSKDGAGSEDIAADEEGDQ